MREEERCGGERRGWRFILSWRSKRRNWQTADKPDESPAPSVCVCVMAQDESSSKFSSFTSKGYFTLQLDRWRQCACARTHTHTAWLTPDAPGPMMDESHSQSNTRVSEFCQKLSVFSFKTLLKPSLLSLKEIWTCARHIPGYTDADFPWCNRITSLPLDYYIRRTHVLYVDLMFTPLMTYRQLLRGSRLFLFCFNL